MNVGIIIFSRTGNTLAVAQKVRDALLKKGHTAVIERVSAQDEDPQSRQPVQLKNAPDPQRFDAVIFGAPVQGFALSPIMKAYLTQMPQITGKAAGCFITQYFPKPWMGGKQAVKQVLSLCRSKGADALKTVIINWTSKSRGDMIDITASLLSDI